MDIEKEKQEIEQLKEQLNHSQKEQELKLEKARLEKKIAQHEFRNKHNKVLRLTTALERGAKGLFKGIGSMFKKGKKAIVKMDKKIEEQKKAEQFNNPQTKPRKIKTGKDANASDSVSCNSETNLLTRAKTGDNVQKKQPTVEEDMRDALDLLD